MTPDKVLHKEDALLVIVSVLWQSFTWSRLLAHTQRDQAYQQCYGYISIDQRHSVFLLMASCILIGLNYTK